MRNDMEIAQANAMLGAGRIGEAVALLGRAAAADPRDPRAPHMLGVALAQAGQLEAGEKALLRARELAPKSGAVLCDLATVLILAKRDAEALPALAQARKLDPTLASALFYNGVALANLGRLEEALAAYDALAKREPKNPVALQNRVALLLKLKRLDEAAAAADALLALTPGHPRALTLRATASLEQGEFAAAVAACDEAIAREPAFAEAHHVRGAALARLDDGEAAVSAWSRAADLDPTNVAALLKLARARKARWELVEAGVAYEQALAIDPAHFEARLERAQTLLACGLHEEAAAALEELYNRVPDAANLLGETIHARAHICDWRDYNLWMSRLNAAIDAGKPASPPFPLLALDVGPKRLLSATRLFAQSAIPTAPAFPPRRAGAGAKIRVAYLSGEFRDQATAYLMAEVYESHDREKFDIFGVDTGRRDDGFMRPRLEKAFGGLKEMSGASDMEIARWLDAEKIDVAVNLNGWFGQSRNGVFALRPCPAQVNFLGFPGTLGADCFDYIVGDRHTIPAGAESDFVEKVVRLPECYQPNDSRRAIAPRAPTRAELGLPEKGFVFCCFNNFHKIAPTMFDAWARLLKEIDGSVLWLIGRNEAAQRNLRAEASRRGVDPARLVFAPYVKLDVHLARHARADLFLDTLPHNAHTTASDALWAGAPVLTLVGDTFAGRVGESLLNAVGLPELVTRNMDDYMESALELARDPALLRVFRERLAENRAKWPLFNGARHTRHLERAYAEMAAISKDGAPPRAFDVAAVD